MAKVKLTEGVTVKNAIGETGTVRALYPLKNGGRGRPKTIVTVHHEGTDTVAEYPLAELTAV